MGKPLSKWQVHGFVLLVLTAIAGTAVACLFSSSQGRGLDGLGAALLGVMVIYAFAVHAVISTIVVALSKDRSGVAVAHLVSPAIVIAIGTAMVWVK